MLLNHFNLMNYYSKNVYNLPINKQNVMIVISAPGIRGRDSMLAKSFEFDAAKFHTDPVLLG